MSTGWICPKCGRVYAPFIYECAHCNNNEVKPDPGLITLPWTQDYSKYKSETTADLGKCDQDVTITDEYLKYTTSTTFNNEYVTYTHSNQEPLGGQMICDSQGCREVDLFGRPIKGVHKYSSQETLQESLDGLNTELENLGVPTTNLDELKDIKTIIEDIHQSENIAQDESDNITDTAVDFLKQTYPNGGMKPNIIIKCEHCGATAYLNKRCPICDKFNGDKSLESDTTYMLEHWVCSRCGKVHFVFPLSGCECGAPLEYLTYVI